MNLAYRYGATRIWIVNVGDLKPMEIPMEFFLTFAWDPERWSQNELDAYLRLWAAREFGPAHATDIADLVAKYAKYNGRRKPELLEPGTFSLVNYNEADRVEAEWQTLQERAETVSAQLPPESRDSFFELVLHPIKACAIVNELYIAAARNRLYASQGRARANECAAKARELFQADAKLTDYYHHQLTGGKWNHMMAQTHIGYTGWQEPPVNNMPTLQEVAPLGPFVLDFAIEGSRAVFPVSSEPAALPAFDVFNRQRYYVDVFNCGRGPVEFRASASEPWVVLSATGGTVTNEQRLWVSIDWSRVPVVDSRGPTLGWANATVKISGLGRGTAPDSISVLAFNPEPSLRAQVHGFVEANGYVAIEAAHYARRRDTASARWELLPDHGRTGSAMTVFPVTAPSANPPLDSPCLEYDMHLFTTGRVEVALLLSPSLSFARGRAVRIGVAFDDAAPQLLTVVPKGYVAGDGNRDWEESVKDNIRTVKSAHVLAAPGPHTLKVWMVDPGVVLQRVLVNTGGVRPSYLGPPESFKAE
jgi:hypothetical protein